MSCEVSIIVPVYNAKSTLRNCVESILAQSYSDYEILLVDDGSKDESKNLCDEYARTNTKIKVFHQANAGVSAARNVGIKNAVGKFIMFVDSDDTVKKDLLLHLINGQRKIDADFTFSGIDTVIVKNNGKRISRKRSPEANDMEMREFVDKLDLYGEYINSPYKSLFLKELIDNNAVLFPNGVQIGEDRIFVLKYLLCCERVSAVSESDYEYMNTPLETLTSKRDFQPPKYNFEAAKLKTQLKEKYGVKCKEVEYSKQFYNTLIFNFMRVFGQRLGCSSKEKFRYCLSVSKDLQTKKYVALYQGYSKPTKLLRFFLKYKMNLALYIMWSVRCLNTY